MWKIFSSENKTPRERTFSAPLNSVGNEYNISAASGHQIDGIRCGDVNVLTQKGRRLYEFGNATVGLPGTKQGVVVHVLHFRILQMRSFRVADARAAGYDSITSLREHLADTYGDSLKPGTVFTQVWVKYVGELK